MTECIWWTRWQTAYPLRMPPHVPHLLLLELIILINLPYADPESVVKGGPTAMGFLFVFFSLWGEGGSKYHYKRAIIGLPAKHHLNGISLACPWWPKFEFWLGSFVIFRGSRTILLRNPFFWWFFKDPPPSPSWSAHFFSIRNRM